MRLQLGRAERQGAALWLGLCVFTSRGLHDGLTSCAILASYLTSLSSCYP